MRGLVWVGAVGGLGLGLVGGGAGAGAAAVVGAVGVAHAGEGF